MKVKNVDVSLLGQNPYLLHFQYPMKQGVNKYGGQETYDISDDGLTETITKGSSTSVGRWTDARPYFKTFNCRAKLNALRGLSLQARWVWDEIQAGIEFDATFYLMNKSFIVKTCKFPNQRKLNQYIEELIDADFISKTNLPNHYWYNPDLVGKGDTTSVFPKNGKKIFSKKDISNPNLYDPITGK